MSEQREKAAGRQGGGKEGGGARERGMEGEEGLRERWGRKEGTERGREGGRENRGGGRKGKEGMEREGEVDRHEGAKDEKEGGCGSQASPLSRQMAAEALGELLQLTSQAALRPSLATITGFRPMLRTSPPPGRC